MKTYIIFGLEIKFSIRLVRRITYDLPDWADDVHLHQQNVIYSIIYYRSEREFKIPLIKCRSVEIIKITPKWIKIRSIMSTNRKIVLNLYL